ncbi:MAG TPA: patatin-like phospholipase family protein, partial [Gemmatimonadales bacterium]|nr:patatin-like phospholipase family protein [Gemmatimonadales bacterium]
MNVALSLSGGGFRATLFHLGVIGYLRRVGILDRVVAVCGVSGGAIIGAHLVHNWEHYTGSEDAFTKAAREVIRLTQRDVRGRILRRLPWGLFLKPIPLLKISRCGMFERELTRFFDGELLSSAVRNNGHNRPELFILATDLATGQSCSFSARGFSRDGADNAPTMETNVLKTATAVATSASFPGFFPPQVVTPESLGITREAWGAQQESYLTDGGVFDNLGVRKLQSLRQRLSVDVEILSDAGATLEPRPGRFSGLVRTALRAVDILSNRVQTLEYERVNRQDAAVSFAYAHAPGGLPGEPAVPLQRAELNGTGTPALIPIRIKDPVRVDHAPGPSIQAVLQRVRTDLDRFSDTEIRWLVRHGGSVARQAIEHREAVLTDIDLNRGKQAPW